MTLHQLRLLRALAKHRSLTQAGAEMLLSQPAVTLQLKELQKELGTPLYERLGNTLHLTDAGHTLEHYAQRILALVEEAEVAVRTLQQGYGGRIRVGASNTPGIYILPPLLSAFRRRGSFSVTLCRCSDRVIRAGGLVSFDTDMIGPFG